MTRRLLTLTVLLLVAVAACGRKPAVLPPGTVDADKFLYDRGHAAF